MFLLQSNGYRIISSGVLHVIIGIFYIILTSKYNDNIIKIYTLITIK